MRGYPVVRRDCNNITYGIVTVQRIVGRGVCGGGVVVGGWRGAGTCVRVCSRERARASQRCTPSAAAAAQGTHNATAGGPGGDSRRRRETRSDENTIIITT